MTNRISGGEMLVTSLIEHGVDTIFGIPGIQLYDLVDALYDVSDQISLLAPRHEQSTTYMADGYARATRKPGIAMVVPGPGVLNATAGLVTAMACSSPILVLCGQIDSALIDAQKYGALHEIPDQTGTLRSLTKWVGTARTAHEIPDLVTLAFHHMLDGVPGPVALELPPDVLAELVEPRNATTLMAPPPQLTPAQIETVLDRISRSSFPYLLVGGGCIGSGAGEAILELATTLNCPVIQTRNGRGAVDAAHPLVVDPYLRQEIIEHADLAIILGSRMGTGAGAHIDLGTENIININAEVGDLVYPRPPTEIAIIGDVNHLVSQLNTGIAAQQRTLTSKWATETIQAIKQTGLTKLDNVTPQTGYLNAIHQAMPNDTILVSEYTQVGYLSTITYPTGAEGGFISPGYQGTLGYGFATAIGAQVGAQNRRVVSISGDGGFSWTLPELATLKRYQIPLITIVFNDGRYGNVFRSQKYSYDGRIIGSELTNPEFMTLAEAYGVTSYSVEKADDLHDVLTRILGSDPEPVLIEVKVDEFPSPWDLFDEPGQ